MFKRIKSKIKERVIAVERSRLISKRGLQLAVDTYSDELENSGVIEEIYKKNREFDSLTSSSRVRGHGVTFGGLGEAESKLMYSLIRHYKPLRVVETGVCNGVSSYLILEALMKNGSGKLYSIDLPEVEGNDQSEDFWSGKGGAAIPVNKGAGWIVPDSHRGHWDLRLGNSFEILPAILDELGSVDMFLHDSEHSYECMDFEYNTVWPKLNSGGILLSDDIGWNRAFADFQQKVSSESGRLSVHLGVVFK